MPELPQIDPIFSHQFLFSLQELESLDIYTEPYMEFNALLGREGIRFMVFAVEEKCYMRVFHSRKKLHRHETIIKDFMEEARTAGVDGIIHNGGGYIRGEKTAGGAALEFYGSSHAYGSFNKEALDALLKEHLDKRLSYKLY